ncbi:MAG: SEL1-like repeat protein [Clostridiales bacterium]|nr:SEL1-like repeat protein [Clostridiales bacterium]
MKITEDMLETMVKKANESGWRMKPVGEGEKKALDGALRSYASGARREDVVAFFDTSLFGSGKAGFLLTAEAVYSDCFSRGGASATRLPLEDIRSVEPVQRGKRSNTVYYWDGGSVTVELSSAHRNGLLALLNVAAQGEGQLRELVADCLPEEQGTADAARLTPEEIFRAAMDCRKDRKYVEDDIFFLLEQAARMGYAEAQNELAGKYRWRKKDETRAVCWYEKAAMQGHVKAQCSLAGCYYDGEGVTKDMARSAYWYEKAAEQGNTHAQYMLQSMYYLGEGVAKNRARAAYWCEKAARQGDKAAQRRLADLYQSGEGVAKDMTRAVYWYEQAVRQGEAEAMERLASCYENGAGVEKDEQKALSLYKQAVKGGWTPAQKDVDRLNAPTAERAFALGCLLYNRENRQPEDLDLAVSQFTKAAELGHAKAQFILGFFYDGGEGVAADAAKAAYWYEQAADRDLVEAQYTVAQRYDRGKGVKENKAKAAKWYKKAAEQGHAKAQFCLGICYYTGEGVKANKAEAVRWYEKAAKQGYEKAQCNLGICYIAGEGVTADRAKAKEWLCMAAGQGNENAMKILREYY